MANPAITGSMTLKQWGTVIDISTTTAENILSNTAASGKVIEAYLTIGNDDGSNAATITVAIYNQDGAGMNTDAGIDIAAIGVDTVAGSSKGAIVTSLQVAAGGAQVIADKLSPIFLMEDTSIVITASAANDLTATLNYIVKG